MVIIRPIALEDLEPVLQLSTLAGFGLTTLPCDANLLRRRIRDSLRGFQAMSDDDGPRGQTYLFVLEDLANRRVAGTCGIVAKAGGFDPFYAYRIETAVHESAMLKVRKEISTLHLIQEHDGPCEIGSLFLSADHRQEGNGRLLSLSRFLFMAEHPGYFDPVIVAEMRGVVDARGRSPFWDALGRKFFDIDFPTADYLSMVSKKFIAELMPRHPIYVPLLPQEAQEVIGQVHDQTRPALRLLQEEGFAACGMVDIFEAGPIVRTGLSEIRTVRQSVRAPVAEVTAETIRGEPMHLSKAGRDFRACRAVVEQTAGGIRLSADAADALRVRVGDAVRYAATRAGAAPAAWAEDAAAHEPGHDSTEEPYGARD